MEPKPSFFLGLSFSEVIVALTFLGACIVGYVKYVHAVVKKYWHRLRTPTRSEELKNLLRFVPDQKGNAWEKVEKDGTTYLNLMGNLKVTNTSEDARVLISKSGIVGYDASGYHMVPNPTTNVWAHDNIINTRAIVELRFNYQIKDFRHKVKRKMLFDLYFIDQFATEYRVEKLEFDELRHPNPTPSSG